MPIRDRITWGTGNPLSDPRYAELEQNVSGIRQGRLPPNVKKGRRIFENRDNDLPSRPNGYYTEYDVEPAVQGKDRGSYRIVLGGGGEVYITGTHYRDFRQIINMPSNGLENPMAARIEKDRNEALATLDRYRQKLENLVDVYSSEHKAQQAILINTKSLAGAAIGFAGYVATNLFNTPIPDLLIWNNASQKLTAAETAIRNRDVKKAMKALILARFHYLTALQQYTTWKDGAERSCVKMQVAIGVVAVALVAGAVGAFAATCAAADGVAVTAAEQTMVRVTLAVQRADLVIKAAESNSIAQEAAGDLLEDTMEEFLRLRTF